VDNSLKQAGNCRRIALTNRGSHLSLPSYIYRWHTYPGARHMSALSKDSYQRRGEERIEPIRRVNPGWSQKWECAQRR